MVIWTALLALWIAPEASRRPGSQAATPEASRRPGAAAPASQGQTPGEELSVAVLTVGPGEAVWERWGHNTIIITDRIRGTSVSYNWGIFDFRQENFLLRFIQGRMWYAMWGRPAERDLALYRRDDRGMVLQVLALKPAARAALRSALEANDTDATRNYFYDYYRDNCSTRVRDALDAALGGALKAQFGSVSSGTTWRWETRRITGPDLPLYTGILLGEGRPVDASMSRWEQMFLPLRVLEALREVRVVDAAGATVPLVAAERELHRSSRYVEPPSPRVTWLWLVGGGVMLGLLLTGLGVASRTVRGARVLFGAVATSWSFAAGLGGLVLLGLWFLTDHWVSRANENVLLLTPLSLALVILVPLALGRNAARWGPPAVTVAKVVLAAAAVAFLLKLLPRTSQENMELIGMVVPVHAGLFFGLRSASRQAS